MFRSVRVAVDVAVLSTGLCAAFYLRFDGSVPPEMVTRLMLCWPYVVALEYGLLALWGIPRFSWRYVGLREVIRILQATLIATAILAAVRLLGAGLLRDFYPWAGYLPLGVIAINSLLAFVGVVGVRVLRRVTTERAEVRRLRNQETELVRTLLVGAGRGGVMVAKEIAGRPELGIATIGFIDDDSLKQGSVIHGLPVLGTTAEVRRIARQMGARQAIITIPNAPGHAVRAISSACQEAGLQVKVVPGLFQLVGGALNLTRMRDVAIEDLLRREPIVLDDRAISSDLCGSTVVVTGAGGSIGSELGRQICRFRPARLILAERSENALFTVHRELAADFPTVEVVPCLADIGDKQRLEDVFTRYRPEVVFHAAAHKHVPMMEWNPEEAIRNNIFGTKTLADVSHAHQVRAFVMISTDKAVNPTSVMGATKRVAELYVQALAKKSNSRFVTVRFGNVLGSNGSVVPIFKEQIARGGPVTVTHPEMKRYFMTIPEACQLVLQAGAMGQGGEIFVLDMGEPVKIVDLARDLIQLSGFRADEIPIEFTGIRPGEKLYEELLLEEENTERTRHPKIFVGRTRSASYDDAVFALQRLVEAATHSREPEAIRTALRSVLPEYRESESMPATSPAVSEPSERPALHAPARLPLAT